LSEEDRLQIPVSDYCKAGSFGLYFGSGQNPYNHRTNSESCSTISNLAVTKRKFIN
jgi:hypothetical protein